MTGQPQTSAPFVHKADSVRLRVLGTKVSLLEEIRLRAQEDLGFPIDFIVLDGVACQEFAATHPASFDVYDQWYNNIDIVWSSGALQPIEISKLKYWDKITSLAKTGMLSGRALVGEGDAPVKRLYVQPDRRLGSQPSELISAMPGVHNVDAFGYLPDELRPRLGKDEAESWGWLVDSRFAGRVALIDDPAIGAVDAALALQAKGLASFENIGNLSLKEIDSLVRRLISLKKAGHFRALWKSVDEATDLMVSGGVSLESMWSPTWVSLRARQVPVRYAAPREGYRAWFGCLGISSRASGRVLEAAYEFLNWWLAGWPGALMMRQGYYISVLETLHSFITPEEWAFWYMGEPAACDLVGPNGEVVVRKGERRNGGSYWDRVSKIVVWNSTIDEHNYLVRRWNEFVSA